MKTSFTSEQLQDSRTAEADQILRSCQHFGFCTSGCPTYILLKDERDSPRGRIDLIKEMLEAGKDVDPVTVDHLDKCLSCGSCVTTCAVKVDYPHLIDHARSYIEEHYRRPLKERLLRALLARVLPRPALFRVAIHAARLMRPVRFALPHNLSPLFDLAPRMLPPRTDLAAVYPASGEQRHRVGLLAGCAQQVLEPEINAATIRLLNRLGCEVIVPPAAGCCGSLALHIGKQHLAQETAKRNILAWQREIELGRLDAIIVNSSGCGSTMKDYAHLLRDSELAPLAQKMARLSKDVTEWLVSINPSPPAPGLRYPVVYHDPCSMRNIQKVTAQPRKLLRAAGFEVHDVPEGHFCCGSAGTYNMLQPVIARELGRRKAENLHKVSACIGVTGNIGCLTQIRQYTELPMVHTMELLDWAYGGPMPERLRTVRLEPLPESDLPTPPRSAGQDVTPFEATPQTQGSGSSDIGVW